MGRIDRLEVENFKSYRGHQVIGPFHPFSCVIGPNGAGKSNLMDAISFVVCVQTAQLRGTQLRDLIYNASDDSQQSQPQHKQRGSSASSAAQRCYVRLVFVDDDSSEIVFQRSITPSGASEYRVNNRSLTAEQYHAELARIGVLVKTRNFLVFQGDVENLASRDARELSALLDQLSGSRDYEAEYEEAKKAVEKADETTKFNFTLRKSMAAEKKQYREQTAEAEQYKRLLDKRSDLVRDRVLWQLRRLGNDREQIERQLDAERGEYETVRRQQESANAALSAKQREYHHAHEASATAERHVTACRAAAEKHRPKLIKLKEQVQHTKKKISDTEAAVKRMQDVKASHEQRLTVLEEDLRQVAQVRDRLQEEMRNARRAGLQLPAEQVATYARLKETASSRTVKQRQELTHLERLQAHDAETLRQHEVKESELTARLQQMRKERETLIEQRANVERALKEHETRLGDLRREATEHEAARASAAAKMKDLEAKRAEVQHDLNELHVSRQNREQSAKREEILATLKRLVPGVVGRLSDLCKPSHRKFNVAATVALGSRFDAIVVETRKAGRDCIEVLREQQFGTATFLPLDALQPKPIDERGRRLGGSARLVIDVLEFPKSITKAVQYACGNSVVVDTLSEAQTLVYERREPFKVVSLDGTVIHKNGNMTGGPSDGATAGSRRWDESAYEELKRRLHTYDAEMLEVSQALRNVARDEHVRQEIGKCESMIQSATVDKAYRIKELGRVETNIRTYSNDLEATQPLIARLRATMEAREADMSTPRREIARIEDDVFADFAASVGVADMREYDVEAAKASASRMSSLTQNMSKLQEEIKLLRSRDMQSRVDAHESSLDKERAGLAKAEKALDEAQRELEALEANLTAANKSLEESRTAVTDCLTERKEIKHALAQHVRTAMQLHKSISAKESLLEQLRVRRKDIFQQCRLDQVELPIIASKDVPADGSLPVEEAAEKVQVDFEGLDKRLRKLNTERDELSESFFETRIAEMSTQIERMEPNMRAQDRLDDVQARLRTSEADLESSKKEMLNATVAFEAVRKKRSDAFMAMFTHLASVIDATYKELTRGETHPGGTAYLTLENTQEPFNGGVKYFAMPPMKRFRDMDQLSGGEKTMAALALLFAIQSFQPAPFFVLDEVDAALDKENVSRLASFIRGKASESLQFVVISLKDLFYTRADALVGIYRDPDNACSRTMTLGLDEYSAQLA